MAKKIYKVFCVKLPFLIVFLKALNRFFVLHMFQVYTKNKRHLCFDVNTYKWL